MKKTKRCKSCGGTGISNYEDGAEIDCPKCKGTGKQKSRKVGIK